MNDFIRGPALEIVIAMKAYQEGDEVELDILKFRERGFDRHRQLPDVMVGTIVDIKHRLTRLEQPFRVEIQYRVDASTGQPVCRRFWNLSKCVTGWRRP